MTVKEAIIFFIFFGGHTFEIIAYLLSFSNSIDLIFGLKKYDRIWENVTTQYWNLNSRSIYITPAKDIHY